MKRKLNGFLILGAAGLSSVAFAQQSPPYNISWAGGAQAVPTMGVYALVALSVLLAFAAFFVLRTSPGRVRVLCAAASIGLMATAVVGTEQTQALVPELEATECSSPAPVPVADACGQQLRNSCGSPITVTITVTDQNCGELVGGTIKSGDVLEDGATGFTPACVNYCA